MAKERPGATHTHNTPPKRENHEVVAKQRKVLVDARNRDISADFHSLVTQATLADQAKLFDK
jgi:hypothetical protein